MEKIFRNWRFGSFLQQITEMKHSGRETLEHPSPTYASNCLTKNPLDAFPILSLHSANEMHSYFKCYVIKEQEKSLYINNGIKSSVENSILHNIPVPATSASMNQ